MHEKDDTKVSSTGGLAGRICLVTGASSGLGAQVARALAAAGAVPVLAARRLDRLQQVQLEVPQADIVACDVADADDRERLIETVIERHGRIDGLINNAGIAASGPALRGSVEDFTRVIDVNLVAPFALSCAAARHMREGGGRSIVNVASLMGRHTIPQLPDAAYVASKAGLIGLTRELASQWGRHGIRVNAVAPGFFASEMTAGMVDGDDAFPEFLTGQTPLGRGGRAGELDEAVLFLLGPGSSFVTGAVLAVDGGLGVR
jgi:NAD(P)-dependent dehydrogenase (short-subunit alcohol dehydrogenase family)